MSHDTTVTSNRHTSGQKIKTTVRVDAEFWREFVADCRRKGVRTCSVLEALGKAWLYGGAMVPGLGKPQSVNIVMVREINVPEAQKGVEARMAGVPAARPSRKWSSRRVPRDARCIGCKHHGRQAEYYPPAQGLLIYHWCKVRGRALCDVPDDVLRTCELRES